MTEYVEVARVRSDDSYDEVYRYRARCVVDDCYANRGLHGAAVYVLGPLNVCSGFGLAHYRSTGHEVVIEERKA